MKRDLLDAIGKIDPRYIEEAAGVQKRPTEIGKTRNPARSGTHIQEIRSERRRSGWAVAAAALFLAAALGVGWLLLSRRGGSAGPANAPAHSGETLLTSTEAGEDPKRSDTGEDLTPAVDPGRNALDLDFEAAFAGTDSEELAETCRWLKTLTPSAKNEMTGLFAGKNLILITAQCLAPEVIDESRTPTLYRLAKEGIEFTDYYQPAWGGAAITGEFAILTGLYPADGVQSMHDVIDRDMPLTLGNQLRRQGYFSRAYCNDHSFDYNYRNLTHTSLGYDRLIGIGNGLEEGVAKTWTYSDRETVDYTISQYIHRQPFSVYYMLCADQGLYDRRFSRMIEKHWPEVEHLPCSDTVKAYLAANMEVEYALRDLVEALEDAGIADETVIVLTSSEYPYALEKNEDWGNTEDYLAELRGKPVENCFERDRSTLIVWSGCLEGKGYKVTTPTSSLDIVPTLSNLFGLDYDSRLLVGRDVFSEQEPLVFWPDGSWKTDRYGYLAETGAYSSFDGSMMLDEYSSAREDAVQARIRYSKAMLETDLFSRLFPERSGENAPLSVPGPDPCEVVRDTIDRVREQEYTISLSVEEVREDETEKQRLLAGDLSCAMARDGFGANLLTLTELDPKDVTVVYARYTAEFDHTKVPHTDGLLDQYFCLTRGEDGNWSIFTFTSTASVAPPVNDTVDPVETADDVPQLPPEMSLEELEALLGYGWKLPEAGSYPGEIVSRFDESLGEIGGILLEYRFDGHVAYAAKYADDGMDLYGSWAQGSAERGSELIDGVEVRFLGEPTVPDSRDIAFWQRDGFQYYLSFATAPGVDLLSILPLFMEGDAI